MAIVAKNDFMNVTQKKNKNRIQNFVKHQEPTLLPL